MVVVVVVVVVAMTRTPPYEPNALHHTTTTPPPPPPLPPPLMHSCGLQHSTDEHFQAYFFLFPGWSSRPSPRPRVLHTSHAHTLQGRSVRGGAGYVAVKCVGAAGVETLVQHAQWYARLPQVAGRKAPLAGSLTLSLSPAWVQ
ncbi:hypothetical protein E2C01_094122 [Portunus trituberculatus]|uniref:Uncharacterized protein n=1 Tax=Portunus trituberculatus TaxID=210409 RepID=A0A5B7JKW4_PORTR|nr:hypothetical protein [Portunus trituberculatus]